MLLEVENLNAHYGKSHVLQGVSLSVDAGEAVCLLGRNGVGKSTTLKAIMGLVPPTGGVVRLRGRAIERSKPWTIARLGIGYVPEDRRVFGSNTVHENLLLGVKAPVTGGKPAWTVERIFGLLPRLRERCAQLAGTLSGGEQQLLTIARTLVGNPEVLLVDEPTEGLAPLIVAEVEKILVEIQASGTAVLLVEQALDTAFMLATRAYVMSKGKVVWSGNMDALKAGDEDSQRHLLAV
jgi:branched-chain amino acid transport system ATP-binding protein